MAANALMEQQAGIQHPGSNEARHLLAHAQTEAGGWAAERVRTDEFWLFRSSWEYSSCYQQLGLLLDLLRNSKPGSRMAGEFNA